MPFELSTRPVSIPVRNFGLCKLNETRMSSDETYMMTVTSFGIEIQIEEAKGNERSPSVALLCAGLLRRGMVH